MKEIGRSAKKEHVHFFINEIDYSSTVLHCYDKSSSSECSLIDKNQHLLTYEVRSADAALLQETRNLIKSSMEVIYWYDYTDISIDLWRNGHLFSDYERLYFIKDEENQLYSIPSKDEQYQSQVHLQQIDENQCKNMMLSTSNIEYYDGTYKPPKPLKYPIVMHLLQENSHNLE